MRLYLIRHAQSGNNILIDEIGRSHDPKLTPVGERQAQKLAAYLASQPDMPTGAFGSSGGTGSTSSSIPGGGGNGGNGTGGGDGDGGNGPGSRLAGSNAR